MLGCDRALCLLPLPPPSSPTVPSAVTVAAAAALLFVAPPFHRARRAQQPRSRLSLLDRCLTPTATVLPPLTPALPCCVALCAAAATAAPSSAQFDSALLCDV